MVPCSVVRPQHRRVGNNGEKVEYFRQSVLVLERAMGFFVHLQALSHITSWRVSTEALVSQSLCVFLPGAPLKPNKTYLPLLSLLVDVCRVISFLQVCASCICNDSSTKKSTKLEATEKLSQEGSKGFPLLLKVCYIISSAVLEIFTCWLLFNWFNMWLQGGWSP